MELIGQASPIMRKLNKSRHLEEHLWHCQTMVNLDLDQGSSNLAHNIHFSAEFSSNPNQTHMGPVVQKV